jgi:hypothetical protein
MREPLMCSLEASDGHLVPYEELAERAGVLQGDGFVVRVTSLGDIVRAKERADRPKDREALPRLRALQDGLPSLTVNHDPNDLGCGP